MEIAKIRKYCIEHRIQWTAHVMQRLINKPLHVVCGIGDDKLWIITAYRPDETMWDSSFTRRKV